MPLQWDILTKSLCWTICEQLSLTLWQRQSRLLNKTRQLTRGGGEDKLHWTRSRTKLRTWGVSEIESFSNRFWTFVNQLDSHVPIIISHGETYSWRAARLTDWLTTTLTHDCRRNNGYKYVHVIHWMSIKSSSSFQPPAATHRRINNQLNHSPQEPLLIVVHSVRRTQHGSWT